MSSFLALLFCILPALLFAQENSFFKDLEQYEKRLKDDWNKHLKKTATILANNETIDWDNIKFDPMFLKLFTFYADETLINRINVKNENDLLFSIISLGLNNNTVIKDVSFFPHKDATKPIAMPIKSFIDIVESEGPKSFREVRKLYSKKNLGETIASLKKASFRNIDECHQFFDHWSNHPHLGALCYWVDRHRFDKKKSEKIEIEKMFGLEYFPYWRELCINGQAREVFCSSMAQNSWKRMILLGQKEKFLNICKHLNTNKEELCLETLRNESICVQKVSQKAQSIPSLLPCSTVSEGLLESEFVGNDDECPLLSEHLGVNHWHRIITHFMPAATNKNKAKEVDAESELLCKSNSFKYMNQMFSDDQTAKIKFQEQDREKKASEDSWPLSICYSDRVLEKRNCLNYVPGAGQISEYSETKVLSSILQKNYGMREKDECSIVTVEEYNPFLLKYKVGCFIVVDVKNCTLSSCKRKIFLDQREYPDIEYQGQLFFNFFPISFKGEGKSSFDVILKKLKLSAKGLTNLSDLMSFLKRKERKLIMGIGCAEDLVPDLFFRKSFLECTPLPFLILKERDSVMKNQLFVLTALDHPNVPRIVLWPHIFQSVSLYKQLHPLSAWGLYGLWQ